MMPAHSAYGTHPDAVKTIFWIDLLTERLMDWLDGPLVKQAAGEVARECRAAVTARAISSVGLMGAHQSRGYVRALAPSFIAREIDAVLSRRRVGLSLGRRVFAEAVEQVIRLVADDLACAGPASESARPAKAA
ncbi:MAG: hypothetical protein ABR915_03540 [Thermoguttaceae bacterium]|jgi:hypothetical protein